MSKKWLQLLKIRDACNLSIEEKRANKEIGSSLEAEISIKINQQMMESVQGIDFAELCITSSAKIQIDTLEKILVETKKAKGNKCPVCWKISENPCPRHENK